jgi:hypothetical protein
MHLSQPLQLSLRTWALAGCLALLAASIGAAQEPADEGGLAQPETGPYKRLAPGVETVIPADYVSTDTFSRHDVVEIVAENPEFGEREYSFGEKEYARDVVFQHRIWCLEFTFKPVRFIEVDVPTPDGFFERKNVWYMVYHVKNTGQSFVRDVAAGGDDPGRAQVSIEQTNRAVHFIPRFLLESWDTGKRYPDRLIPIAIPAIQEREDPNRRFLSTVDIAGDIPVSSADADESAWGVVTWTDVDPATDHFTIYVQGLTNAYQWIDEQSADGEYVYQPDDPIGTGRQLLQKTLRLNFWRPSDRYHEHEREIRFGYWQHEGNDFDLPQEDRVDYRWFFCDYDYFRPKPDQAARALPERSE